MLRGGSVWSDLRKRAFRSFRTQLSYHEDHLKAKYDPKDFLKGGAHSHVTKGGRQRPPECDGLAKFSRVCLLLYLSRRPSVELPWCRRRPKKDAPNFFSRLPRDAGIASVPVRISPCVCGRPQDWLAAVAQQQGNNADPNSADEGGLPVCVFGFIKRRSTVSGIHEQAEGRFAKWCPDLPA